MEVGEAEAEAAVGVAGRAPERLMLKETPLTFRGVSLRQRALLKVALRYYSSAVVKATHCGGPARANLLLSQPRYRMR